MGSAIKMKILLSKCAGLKRNNSKMIKTSINLIVLMKSGSTQSVMIKKSYDNKMK